LTTYFLRVQWNSPKNAPKPGNGQPGMGWSPQPMAATTGANYRPMVSNELWTIDFYFFFKCKFLIIYKAKYTISKTIYSYLLYYISIL
jgi:hypothetical protein